MTYPDANGLDEEIAAIAMAKALRCYWALMEYAPPAVRGFLYARAGVDLDVGTDAWTRCDRRAVRYARIYHGLFVGWDCGAVENTNG